MEVVNPFILKNKERMIVFLDQLSLVTDPNPPLGMFVEQNSNHNVQDTGMQLIDRDWQIKKKLKFYFHL